LSVEGAEAGTLNLCTIGGFAVGSFSACFASGGGATTIGLPNTGFNAAGFSMFTLGTVGGATKGGGCFKKGPAGGALTAGTPGTLRAGGGAKG